MSVVVLVLGLLAAGAGVLAIASGAPVYETTLGQTLITAGATGISAGLILIGLAALVVQLGRLNAAVRVKPPQRAARAEPQPQPPSSPLPPPPPQAEMVQPPRPEPAPSKAELPVRLELPPRPEPLVARVELPARSPRPPEPRMPELRAPELRVPDLATEASPSSVPRQRPTFPSPDRVVPEPEEAPLSANGNSSPMPAEAAPEPPPSSPVPEVETAREPRLDFLFRSRPARPAAPQPAPQPDAFESLWPKRQGRPMDGSSVDEVPPERSAVAEMSATEPTANPPPSIVPPPPPLEESRTVAILKSGVVDGMAYTLYTDGSIEAQLPQGTVRFGSIAELRAHIESNS